MIAVACEHDQIFDLDPRRTALLSIDFQGDFLRPDGMAARRGLAYETLGKVLPAARHVLDAARAAGMRVIHTRESYLPDRCNLNEYRRFRDGVIGEQGPLGRFLIRGEEGTEIVAEMAPLPGEPVIDKAGFNAFFGTELDTILRASDINRVVIMGLTTQCCISSTLRGAVDLGYFPLLIEDCAAAFDERDHAASIRVIYAENHNFGWVSDAGRLIEALGRAA